MSSLSDFGMKTLGGKEVSMASLKNKVVLIENVASL